MSRRGATVHIVVTDTHNANEVRHLAETAGSAQGTFDVCVNNAGVLAAGALEDIPALNEQVILTNLVGYINGAHEVLPCFKRQGCGIIFIIFLLVVGFRRHMLLLIQRVNLV